MVFLALMLYFQHKIHLGHFIKSIKNRLSGARAACSRIYANNRAAIGSI